MLFIEKVLTQTEHVCAYAQIDEHTLHVTHPKCMLWVLFGFGIFFVVGFGVFLLM